MKSERIIDMFFDYGKQKTIAIVKEHVRNTIKRTQEEMKKKKFHVWYRPIIPYRLEPLVPTKLCKKVHGRPVILFYESEIEAMRKTMPAFDKYFYVEEVKNVQV